MARPFATKLKKLHASQVNQRGNGVRPTLFEVVKIDIWKHSAWSIMTTSNDKNRFVKRFFLSPGDVQLAQCSDLRCGAVEVAELKENTPREWQWNDAIARKLRDFSTFCRSPAAMKKTLRNLSDSDDRNPDLPDGLPIVTISVTWKT